MTSAAQRISEMSSESRNMSQKVDLVVDAKARACLEKFGKSVVFELLSPIRRVG